MSLWRYIRWIYDADRARGYGRMWAAIRAVRDALRPVPF